jgi:hypothetical protein
VVGGEVTSLFVGSTAIRHHFPEFPREPKDVDLWTDWNGWKSKGWDKFWDERLRPYLPESPEARYATPDEIYTIKVSHSPWELENGSWRKHMWDIVWLKQHGARLIPELHDLLTPIWKDKHGAKRVNLNQESGQFFTDAVVRIYDHDSIHDTVAHYDRPLWMEVLKDGESVAMDMEKVWALPFEDQIRLFREEVYATALERWLIPADYKYSPSAAYWKALRKTIVSLTKGRSSQFMIENYDIFQELPKRPSTGRAWYLENHLSNRHLLKKLEA